MPEKDSHDPLERGPEPQPDWSEPRTAGGPAQDTSRSGTDSLDAQAIVKAATDALVSRIIAAQRAHSAASNEVEVESGRTGESADPILVDPNAGEAASEPEASVSVLVAAAAGRIAADVAGAVAETEAAAAEIEAAPPIPVTDAPRESFNEQSRTVAVDEAVAAQSAAADAPDVVNLPGAIITAALEKELPRLETAPLRAREALEVAPNVLRLEDIAARALRAPTAAELVSRSETMALRGETRDEAALPAATRRYALSPQWSERLRKAGRISGKVLAGYLAIVLALIMLYRFINPPASTLMVYRWLGGTPINQTWVPLEDISPNLVRAVIVSEDGRFCHHWGIDPFAVKEAIERAKGGLPRGASTISMQVVKNLFLWPSKSYLRKAIEVPVTLVMELFWPKSRILEIYLNIAECGPGVFGAEAASRHHFRKSAARVGEREAALLAASLPNPFRRDAGDPGPRTVSKASNVQARVRAYGDVADCVLGR